MSALMFAAGLLASSLRSLHEAGHSGRDRIQGVGSGGDADWHPWGLSILARVHRRCRSKPSTIARDQKSSWPPDWPIQRSGAAAARIALLEPRPAPGVAPGACAAKISV